jgi:hypothetical protein
VEEQPCVGVVEAEPLIGRSEESCDVAMLDLDAFGLPVEPRCR